MAYTQSEQDRRIQQSKLSANAGTGSEPTHIDLFSGIGGFSLAAQWAGFRTVAFCEIDNFCRKVLSKNFVSNSTKREDSGIQQERFQSNTPAIHSSIFDFNGSAYRGCDLITGGFPCQPFSFAGKRLGKEDDRHIWPQMLRVISEAKPSWVLGENVVGIDGMELDNCISDLEAIGYEVAPPLEIPACAVDAKHRRMRVWIIANSECSQHSEKVGGCNETENGIQTLNRQNDSSAWRTCGTVNETSTDTIDQRCEGGEHQTLQRQRGESRESEGSYQGWRDGWPISAPLVCGVDDGIPDRTHRLKALGNAIVPQVAYEILREIRQMIASNPRIVDSNTA